MAIIGGDGLELDGFKDKVDFMARLRDEKGAGLIYSNSGPRKARILISKLLEVAKEEVVIYTGGLADDVYTQEMFDDALARGIKPENIRVIYSNENESANLELIAHLKRKGVEIKQYDNVGAHMLVADGDCFRIEHDNENRRALFAFGNVKAKDFLSSFDKLWNVATPA